MADPIAAAEPSEALRKQLESDAGPHATPDQERAAEKRRAALEGRTAVPEERHAREAETAADTPKRARRAKKKT